MVGATDPDPIFSKRKAINALVPYAISLKRDGQEAMVDVISLAATASQSGRFIWHHIGPYTTILFDEPSPPTLNLIITLASSHVPWEELHDGTAVTRWAWAASALPDTEQVDQSVAEVLLQITALDSLRHYIPISIWAWLNKGHLSHPYAGRDSWEPRMTSATFERLGISKFLNRTCSLFGWSEILFTLRSIRDEDLNP